MYRTFLKLHLRAAEQRGKQNPLTCQTPLETHSECSGECAARHNELKFQTLQAMRQEEDFASFLEVVLYYYFL